MSDLAGTKIGKVNDEDLTLADLSFTIKSIDEMSVTDLLIESKLVEQAAEGLEVSVTSDQLQEAANAYRNEKGLLTKKETEEWLESENLSLDEFERKVHIELLKDGIRDKLGTEQAVNKHFAESMTSFDRAVASVIVLNDEGLAKELMNQIEEGEEEFATLAAKHSTDQDSRGKGGSLGVVFRENVDDALEVEIFSGNTGLKGPVKVGNNFYIVKVDAYYKAELDDNTKETIKEALMQDYLSEKSENSTIQLDFL